MGQEISKRKIHIDNPNVLEKKENKKDEDSKKNDSCTKTPTETASQPQQNILSRLPNIFLMKNFGADCHAQITTQRKEEPPIKVPSKDELCRIISKVENYYYFTDEYFMRDCEESCEKSKFALTKCLRDSIQQPLLCRNETSAFLMCLHNCFQLNDDFEPK